MQDNGVSVKHQLSLTPFFFAIACKKGNKIACILQANLFVQILIALYLPP